jgi:hypothetical protein
MITLCHFGVVPRALADPGCLGTARRYPDHVLNTNPAGVTKRRAGAAPSGAHAAIGSAR